ncbi:porin family protein [Carboxylicivirga taeanensis]|uniref:porin family protein n=1 Tax=Carboxylicivirga taeanensis TaxID=1416875 RepID=UPI003F6DC4C3
MKKAVLIFTLMAIVGIVEAQDRIALGLKAGFNSTKIKLSDIPDGETIKNEANSGFLFGAYGRLRLIGNVSFQPEMYYAKKQSEISSTVGAFNVTYHTWDIPLLVNARLLDLKIASIYGLAGPVASFNAKSTTDFPDFKGVDNTNWTFQAGIGAEIWRLTADVRYEWGVKDISKAQFGQKTDVLTFAIGYKLFGI